MIRTRNSWLNQPSYHFFAFQSVFSVVFPSTPPSWLDLLLLSTSLLTLLLGLLLSLAQLVS